MNETTPVGARRERERAATRARILDTAQDLLEREGVAALTMRRIATEIEYTAPIVYQHFANKDALVRELVEQGHQRMAAELEAMRGEPDPEQRLLRAAEEYVRFAGRHPHLYEVMNGTQLDAGQRRTAAEPAYVFLRDVLSDWAVGSDVDLHDGTDACEIVWGTLHGIASLGQLETIGNERARRLASEALRAILLGWRSAGPSISPA